MNAPLNALADFLKNKEMCYTVSEEGNLVAFPFSGEHLRWTTFANTDESGNILTLLSHLPAKVPVAKRAACAKLLARLNYGRRQGAFHLDMSDGEVLYCISNFVGGELVPAELLEALLGFTFSAMDEHGSEVLKLIYGKGTDEVSPPAKNDRFAGGLLSN